MAYVVLTVALIFIVRSILFGVYELRRKNVSGGIFVILWAFLSVYALLGLLY